MSIEIVTLQFSTTPWSVSDRKGLMALWRMRWGNRYSYLIRKMNHSPFSHCDFVLDNGNLLGASDQGLKSIVVEGNPQGVAIRPPSYQNFGYRRRMIIRTDKATKIIDCAKSQLGKPFDNGGLKDFLSSNFPGYRDWRDPGKWFCAELVVWAFETAGYWQYPPLPWPKNRISPTDLLLLFVADPNFVNRATFWNPVAELKLSAWER